MFLKISLANHCYIVGSILVVSLGPFKMLKFFVDLIWIDFQWTC